MNLLLTSSLMCRKNTRSEKKRAMSHRQRMTVVITVRTAGIVTRTPEHLDDPQSNHTHQGLRKCGVTFSHCKWLEVYPVRDRKAETVAQCLQDLVWKHRVPTRIIHDCAAEFLSDVLQETAQLLGLSQLPTSGGHPQTDGLIERFNRTLKQMLAKVVGKKG